MTNLALLEALDDHLVVLDLSGHLVLLVVQARHLGGVELPAVDDVEWVSAHGHHALLVVHNDQLGVQNLSGAVGVDEGWVWPLGHFHL